VGDYDSPYGIPPHLTYREIEIDHCIVCEKTIKETVYCLKISARTVNNHLNNIYRKFGIYNIVGVFKLVGITGDLKGN